MVVGHVAPGEAQIGEQKFSVQNGDIITIDADKNELSIDLSDQEIARRLQSWQAPEPHYKRGCDCKVC